MDQDFWDGFGREEPHVAKVHSTGLDIWGFFRILRSVIFLSYIHPIALRKAKIAKLLSECDRVKEKGKKKYSPFTYKVINSQASLLIHILNF